MAASVQLLTKSSPCRSGNKAFPSSSFLYPGKFSSIPAAYDSFNKGYLIPSSALRTAFNFGCPLAFIHSEQTGDAMATAAGSTSQEYWRPSNPDVARVVTSIRGTCRRCATDYPVGARYCHVCGSIRDSHSDQACLPYEACEEAGSTHSTENKFGLSVPCTVFFVLGIACAVAAALVRILYQEETLVDWQAVQAWRIEWMLGTIASLLAGILLKSKNGST